MNTEKNTILNSIMEKLSIIEKKQEVEVVEEPVQEVELSEEVKEEVVEEVKEEVELSETVEQPKYVTEEMLNDKLTELSELIKEMKSAHEAEKTELSEQVVELSKEPASEPIKHSPESEGVDNGMKYQFGVQRPQGTRSRVMDRISNLK